jgi:hypothetical protein
MTQGYVDITGMDWWKLHAEELNGLHRGSEWKACVAFGLLTPSVAYMTMDHSSVIAGRFKTPLRYPPEATVEIVTDSHKGQCLDTSGLQNRPIADGLTCSLNRLTRRTSLQAIQSCLATGTFLWCSDRRQWASPDILQTCHYTPKHN